MNCDAVDSENIVERYLAGTLGPALKEEWEEHYFGCERCAEMIETWTAIEKPLRAMEAGIRAEIPLPSRERKPAFRSPWLWAGVGIAATLLVCAAGWVGYRDGRRAKTEAAASRAMPSQDLAVLARFDPPAYTAPVMRGIETKAEAEFFKAMKFYQARDYAGAIAGLQASSREDPDAAAPTFFLGACYLLTGRASEAIAVWNKLATGDSPFAAEAQFYSAKAYLAEGKRVEAIVALRPLAASQSEFSQEARRLIERLLPTR